MYCVPGKAVQSWEKGGRGCCGGPPVTSEACASLNSSPGPDSCSAPYHAGPGVGRPAPQPCHSTQQHPATKATPRPGGMFYCHIRQVNPTELSPGLGTQRCPSTEQLAGKKLRLKVRVHFMMNIVSRSNRSAPKNITDYV